MVTVGWTKPLSVDIIASKKISFTNYIISIGISILVPTLLKLFINFIFDKTEFFSEFKAPPEFCINICDIPLQRD
jgi:hypothetical protein